MRSAIIAAALAAGALAVPYAEKRSYAPSSDEPSDTPSNGVGDNSPPSYGADDNPPPSYGGGYDVVYVTNVVTVTVDSPAPEYTPSNHYKHKHAPHKVAQADAVPTSPSSPPNLAPPPASDNSPPAYENTTPEVESSEPKQEVSPTPNQEDSSPPKKEDSSTPKEESSPTTTPFDVPKSDSYPDKCLWHHNMHRKNHTCEALVWSDELAATAQKIADSCIYAHVTDMDGGGYGQNIAAGVKPDDIGKVISDLFYNAEVGLFEAEFGKSNPDMSNFHGWGHVTQMLWKNTTEVGCATSTKCSSLANTGSDVAPYFTVCNYKCPGNYADQYAENVLRSTGELPTIDVSSSKNGLNGNSPPSYKK